MSSFNDQIIADFRANGGVVPRFGSSLVLLHTIGAKSGDQRITPVMSIADGDTWMVIASAAGSPKNPAWYYNIIADPAITIEAGTETLDVFATELEGAEWDDAWARFTAASPAFLSYTEHSEGREFPIFRLTRR